MSERPPPPPRPLVIVLLAAPLVIFLLVAFLIPAIRDCRGPVPAPPAGIDAGPGLEAIAAREREAEAAATRELARIEDERRRDLARFDEAQRRKYEDVRQQGPEAVARWLTDFNRALRDAGRP